MLKEINKPKEQEKPCKIDFDVEDSIELESTLKRNSRVFTIMPKKGTLFESTESEVQIIFKPKNDEVIRQNAFCHIHKADTMEHLQTLKLKIVGRKKVPKAKLSTEMIDVGELRVVEEENEVKKVSFDLINVGAMSLNYKIHWIPSP